ncbi:flagellar motor protein MotB [Segetibacter sp. 3557_3]|uniref:OmpA family protein n=1 Tax=Segetibacter sp. 3557_3 TaxID=2547429 RepID=UPI0010584360|nr:OmpA family protein [Segetibacter sp. 3557_3]TDH21302.1 flagellar motor protein MotB [Segetibacter sp. 3557_3]
MKNLLLICFLLVGANTFAQVYDSDKINPRAIDMYERAVVKLRDGEIREAIPMLKKAFEMDNKYADAILSLAGAYGELKDYQSAITHYEQGRQMDTSYFRYYYLPYSINLAGLGKFDQALDAINRFLTIPQLNERSTKSGQYRKRNYEFGVNYAKKKNTPSYVFAPRNLGDSVNSPRSEYYPSITINDSMFVFTRRGEGFREDFYESTIQPDKTYSRAKLIQGDINLEPSKGAINISQDGEWLLFAGYNFPGGLGDFDLYTSYYTPTGWSDAVNMGRAINSDFWDSSPSLSPDKKALYFSSNRPGGYGGKDLYVSYRQPNGRWSQAANMGPNINTPGDELAPFIHADNATLYFTSDGLPGYGNSDIYLCRKGPDNSWSIPENLGYPINTIESEGSLFVAADGKTAFYSSDRSDSRGALDLYTFELREDVRPARTLFVQGKVFDKKTGKGIPSTVELVDNSNQQSVTKVQTDETGNYFMTLPVGKDYTFSVNRKGYLFFSELYPLSNRAADSTYKKDIPLMAVELNASVILKNILFETNSARLQNISLVELNRLLQLMEENPTVKVQINGHTDNVGKPADNLALSTSRAKSVVDYLTSKGVDPKRLSFKGLGATKPIADNKTEEGRAQNRRTEFVIIGNS